MNYKIDHNKKWDYENGFYLTCETNRIGKFLNQLEIYKKIISLPGDILEFGVYKGTSIIRLLSFRDLLESSLSRKIYGFDIFGKFPNNVNLDSDKSFINQFESSGGYGISKEELDSCLNKKNIINYDLIKGDIFETLPIFLESNPHIRISLLHLDVDVYEPTKFIINTLWDRVVTNGIILLDDYGNVEGASIAIDEFLINKNLQINKLQYNYQPSYIIKS